MGGGVHVEDGLTVGGEACMRGACPSGSVLGQCTQLAAVGFRGVNVALTDFEVTGWVGGADDRGPVGRPVRVAAAHLPGCEPFQPGAIDIDGEDGGFGVRDPGGRLVFGGSPAVEDQLAPIGGPSGELVLELARRVSQDGPHSLGGDVNDADGELRRRALSGRFAKGGCRRQVFAVR